MGSPPDTTTRTRGRLSRALVLEAAMSIADAGGLAALTIRSLAQHLDVKPMAVYHHVANKGAILDAIVDRVFLEIELPVPGQPWRAEITRRAESARRALRRHSWAITLMESRVAPGPATLAHHDAVLGTFLDGGFSQELTAHAYAVLDAFVYGYAVQEASLPFADSGSVTEVSGPILDLIPSGQYPYLVSMAADYYLRPGYDFGREFRYGLDLLLDSFEALRTARPAGSPSG